MSLRNTSNLVTLPLLHIVDVYACLVVCLNILMSRLFILMHVGMRALVHVCVCVSGGKCIRMYK